MRLYSLEEARSALPGLRPVLEGIRRDFLRLRALQAAPAVDAASARTDGSLAVDFRAATAAPGESEQLQARLQRAVGELAKSGIELKDPARGLIDFHHERTGEVVYLCYQLGEDDILYWHTLDGGFAARQPLGA
jgi:hypothetical protein